MMKIWENNGTEEIGLVTPTPDLCHTWSVIHPNMLLYIIKLSITVNPSNVVPL